MMTPRLRYVLLVTLLLSLCLALAAQSKYQDRYWEGRPDFTKGEAKGYFIWNDMEGWHVRWTTGGRTHRFSGTIGCDGKFVDYTAVSRDRGDHITKSAPGTIRFDATASGGADGVDFRLTENTTYVTFDLSVDGARVAPHQVHLGAHNHRAESMPLKIWRVPIPRPGG